MADKIAKITESRLRTEQMLKQYLADGITLDSVKKLTDNLVGANENLTQLDSVLADVDGNKELSVSDVIADSIISGVAGRSNVDMDAIATALDAAARAIDVQLDDIGGMKGAEVLAVNAGLVIHTVLSSNVPGIDGSISDMKPVSSDLKSTKYEVLTVSPVASTGMGEISDGSVISTENASKPMADTERSEVQTFVAGTLTYTFNAKAKSGDADNFPIERGTSEVYIGDVDINDFDAESNELTPVRTRTVDGITYTVTFDYNAGTIKAVLSGDITAGTKIIFVAGLRSKELSKVSGTIEVDIKSNKYVARNVAIKASVNSLDARAVMTNGRFNLMSTGIGAALNKIAQENVGKKIRKATMFAKQFGGVLDLTSAATSASTVSSQYKPFNIEVNSALVDITAKSEIASNAILVGGSGLVRIFSALFDDTEGSARTANIGETGYRELGVINGTYMCYYDPTHDARHPVTNGEHTIFVVGSPVDPTRRAVISGVGLPIVPKQLGTTQDSEDAILLQGSLVIDVNKDPRSRQLVRSLKVKL